MSEQPSQNSNSRQPAISHNPRLTITFLLIGVAVLLVGNGAFGTVLGVCANRKTIKKQRLTSLAICWIGGRKLLLGAAFPPLPLMSASGYKQKLG